MKVKSEDILKPGVVLEVVKIDFNDPEVQELVKENLRQQKLLVRRYSQKHYDNLKKVITI